MINLFLTILSITLTCSILIIVVILLDKVLKKDYSTRWKYVVWAAIAIRLMIPINIRMIDIPLPFMIEGALEYKSNSVTSDNVNYIFNSKEGNTRTIDNEVRNKNIPNSTGNTSILKKTDETTLKNEANTVSKQIDNTTSKKTNKTALINKGDTATNTTNFSTAKNTDYNASTLVIPIYILYIVTIIWIIGAFVFLLYHLSAYYYFKKRINRWSTSVKNEELLDRFNILCTELGLRRKINLVTSKQVSSPILTGFLKPSIVLPDKEFTMEQYQFILKHELIHYKNHDLYYKFLLLFANALHWFNPLVHYMSYLAYNDLELYCDEKLIADNNINYRERYGITLLQIMTGDRKNNHILLSSNFSNKKEQVKNRFKQIMNAKPTRKGTSVIISLFCLFLIVGSMIAFIVPLKVSSAEDNYKQTGRILSNHSLKNVEGTIEISSQTISKQLENTSHILVVGLDTTGGSKNTDSILLVSMNPRTKKILLISFLRDMYVNIPEHGKNKLSASYKFGGIKLMKKTLENNFDLKIDHTCTVDMKAFENIINTIGGVEIQLSDKEAKYLNHTNYISNKKNRTVKAGKQRLNGNQALGYVRVRKVPTLQGENGDAGRTTRLRILLSSVIHESSKKDITVLVKLVKSVLVYVSTDIDYKQILNILNTALNKNVTTESVSIPVAGSYSEKVKDGMYVLIPDLKRNTNRLKLMLN